MKSLLIAMFPLLALVSCSDDDSSIQNEPFFNLSEGNEWIYNRYIIQESSNTMHFEYRDSARVEGQEIIDGKSYVIVNHYVTQNSSTYYALDSSERWRVDENGHLVNPDGIIIHAGTDQFAQQTHDVYINGMIIGQLQYSLGLQTQLDVEGQSYNAYPFSGYFTGFGQANTPDGLGEVNYYQPGLGFVLKKTRFASTSDYFIEDRLISCNVQ
jgi:hypothetical protein